MAWRTASMAVTRRDVRSLWSATRTSSSSARMVPSAWGRIGCATTFRTASMEAMNWTAKMCPRLQTRCKIQIWKASHLITNWRPHKCSILNHRRMAKPRRTRMVIKSGSSFWSSPWFPHSSLLSSPSWSSASATEKQGRAGSGWLGGHLEKGGIRMIVLNFVKHRMKKISCIFPNTLQTLKRISDRPLYLRLSWI